MCQKLSKLGLDARLGDLHDFLRRLGTEAHQGAVGLVIDRDYLEIRFPLESPQGGK